VYALPDPNHFFNVAQRKAQELNAFFTNQFDNLSNYQSHYETTGPEIWEATAHKIDGFATSSGSWIFV
jgi:cysteine synthase A